MVDAELCPPGPCAYKCGNEHTRIAVRMEVGGFWTSVLICDACWNQEHPDRVPVRIVQGTPLPGP